MKRDLKSNILVAPSIAPAAARTATVNGSGVDTRDYDSVVAQVHCGAYTNGTFEPKLEESDAQGSGYTEVASTDMIGAFENIDGVGHANTVQRVGYIGSKRYVRVSIEENSSPAPGTGACLEASIILGHPHSAPVA